MNWIYEGKELKDIPEKVVGFIYKIENETTGKFYVGKKAIFHKTNPEISKKKYDELKAAGIPVTKTKNRSLSTKDKVVWRYKQKNKTKESDWQTYNGSNETLIKDIKRGDNITKTVLKFCYTAKELTYRELEQIVKLNCLDVCECYNENLLGKFYKNVKC